MARKSFGEYFCLPTELTVENGLAYDAIYFVGTIGCVEDPLMFVRQALSKLKSGGILVFNAPNVEACEVFNDIWLSGTTPPDLVNLFSRNIWGAHFEGQADVTVEIETEQPERAFRKLVRKYRYGTSVPLATAWLYANKPVIAAGDNGDNDAGMVRFGRTRGVLSAVYHTVVNSVLALAVGERYPSEFGQYVFMRKK
jgi:SAM-dependent methyltransferase